MARGSSSSSGETARDSPRKSVIPRLSSSRFKRLHERKLGSSLAAESPQTEPPRHDSSSTNEQHVRETAHHVSPESQSHRQARDMEPIFLGEDFSALLKLPISNQQTLWIDLWQATDADEAGPKPNPLDSQYLSSLKSFVGLRCLRVTGMLKSYQKPLFQAIWKMEQLDDLQLRMAEEPRLASGVTWRRIEEGWSPRMHEMQAYISPGNGNGRINRAYGSGEYLDNCVIELAKPKLPTAHPEYEAWMARRLPLAHLTLRGFVVDAIPFCSCFDAQRLRSITFVDCVDAGFCLPVDVDLERVEIRVGETNRARAESVRRVESGDVRRVALRQGREVSPKKSPKKSPSKGDASRGRSRFGWRFRSHLFNAVIEEDEREG